MPSIFMDGSSKILGGIIIKGNTVTNFIGPGDGRRGPRRDSHHAPRRVPHPAKAKGGKFEYHATYTIYFGTYCTFFHVRVVIWTNNNRPDRGSH